MAADGPTAEQDQVLVAALAGGATYDRAGAAAGISARTVRRRMADPGFRARVREASSELARAVAAHLTASSVTAVDRLSVLLDGPDPRVQLAAVRLVLDAALRHREAVELEERMSALEQAATWSADR
jgi:hypothetical protein